MMEPAKDRTSLKGSRTNVAESNQPLLESPAPGDGSGSPEKDPAEIESTVEKDEEGRDRNTQDGTEGERRRLKALSCMDQFTIHMNLLNRDTLHINDHVDLAFEDVLAEPSSLHGFDQVWGLAYMLFSGTKFWVYRVVAAACAVPCGLVWGLLFSLLSVASIWVITPIMKIIDVCLHIVQRIWTGVVHAILDPFFKSCSLMFVGAAAKKPPEIQKSP